LTSVLSLVVCARLQRTQVRTTVRDVTGRAGPAPDLVERQFNGAGPDRPWGEAPTAPWAGIVMHGLSQT
jgi:hypothetical protein